MRIATVLCPIDFSGLDRLEIDVALEVCRAFGAKLVLHHNMETTEPGFSRAWEWHKAHASTAPSADRRLQALLDELGKEVPAEGAITSGLIGQAVTTLAGRIGADLIVLGSHGWSTQDHASVTERLVDDSPCPVLTFQEGATDVGRFRLRSEAGEPPVRVLVPTDLTRDSSAAVGYACNLARRLPLRLDLLHVLTSDQSDRAAEGAQAAIDSHVPPDLVDRVSAHVRLGPAAETIVEYADETTPMFLVLGEHAHGFVRRLLTRDTTRAVVHEVRCPVWVIPPGRPETSSRVGGGARA
jgi:nucleotide-binding universal stress UspA family protein